MLEKEDEKGVELLLHYIGKRYYSVRTFTKEGLQHGVSRALPPNVIKTLNWDDKVYTAFYEKDEKGPYALVFGYFTITGLNVTNPLVTEEAKKDPRLKIVKVEVNGGSKNGVTRGCGSYIIAGRTYIENSLPELVEIIQDAQKRLGVKSKIMVAGKFHPLEPFAIRGAPFTRGVVKAKVPMIPGSSDWRNAIPLEPQGPHITALHNYELGKPSKRRKKQIQEGLESIGLDKWVRVEEG